MKWKAACGTAFLWLVLGEKPKEGGSGQHCEGLGLGFFIFFYFFQNCPPFCVCVKGYDL
jgi:hypothetical protein